VSLEVVAKYGMATMLLPSLATGRGDEEDTGAGTGDEAADVRERDLLLVHVVKANCGYE
jgi:hypothetical protein